MDNIAVTADIDAIPVVDSETESGFSYYLLHSGGLRSRETFPTPHDAAIAWSTGNIEWIEQPQPPS